MRRTTRAEEARNWLAERQNEAIAELTLLVSTVAMVAENHLDCPFRVAREAMLFRDSPGMGMD
jgi:hypothetical protein